MPQHRKSEQKQNVWCWLIDSTNFVFPIFFRIWFWQFAPTFTNHTIDTNPAERRLPTAYFQTGAHAMSQGSVTYLEESPICHLMHTWIHRHERLASFTGTDRGERVCFPSHLDSTANFTLLAPGHEWGSNAAPISNLQLIYILSCIYAFIKKKERKKMSFDLHHLVMLSRTHHNSVL